MNQSYEGRTCNSIEAISARLQLSYHRRSIAKFQKRDSIYHGRLLVEATAARTASYLEEIGFDVEYFDIAAIRCQK